ncbi:MAG: 6,7-dimethyl-8-ribityllumazine synthase [Gammaproteobacteria bacterium]
MSVINKIEASGGVNDVHIAIVASRYNSFIVDRLLQGCLDTLTNRGVQKNAITLVRVPGAFEIPVAAARVAGKGEYDAVIALGAVIRGETPHFEYIARACSSGLAKIALQADVPVIFGVLTVDSTQQALDRSGDEESNKGSEAACTALDMISVFRKIS